MITTPKHVDEAIKILKQQGWRKGTGYGDQPICIGQAIDLSGGLFYDLNMWSHKIHGVEATVYNDSFIYNIDEAINTLEQFKLSL